MRRNRYILCLLLGAFLLYFAVPRFFILADGVEGIFSISWLLLAILVIAGNLSAILYSPKQYSNRRKLTKQNVKRSRYYD